MNFTRQAAEVGCREKLLRLVTLSAGARPCPLRSATHYSRFITTTRQGAPVLSGLAVGAAC